MIAQDFLFDEDADLRIENGDLIIGPSDEQHVEDIILSGPGWYKEFPQVGVNARVYIGSSGKQQELERAIRLQLQADGYTVNRLKTEQNPDGTFTISNFDIYRS